MVYKFLIFILFTLELYSQNLKVDYKINIKNNALEENKSTYLTAFISQAKNDIFHYPMDFIISNNSYSIDFTNSLQVDSQFQNIPTSKSLTLSFIGLGESVYFTEGKSYKLSKGFIIKYDNDKLGYWEITNDSKQILGFKCYKAIFIPILKELKDKKMFIPNYAWIATEIPYQGGPTVFGNTPGLILELDMLLANIKAVKLEETNQIVKSIEVDKFKILNYSEAEKHFSSPN
jgi:GLPGLI family protein